MAYNVLNVISIKTGNVWDNAINKDLILSGAILSQKELSQDRKLNYFPETATV